MNRSITYIILILAVVILPTNNLAQTETEQLASALVGQWRGIITDGQETRSFDLDLKNSSADTLSGEMSLY